jgi:ferrous iron transport protein A
MAPQAFRTSKKSKLQPRKLSTVRRDRPTSTVEADGGPAGRGVAVTDPGAVEDSPKGQWSIKIALPYGGDVVRRLLPTVRPSRATVAPPDSSGAGAVPLCDLAPGSRASVVALSGDTPPATARRLLDLGFTEGTAVEVVRRAPLRDPVIYRLRDYDVCLRRAQAMCVLAHAVAG